MFLKHRKVAVELPPPAHKDEREYTPIGPVSQSMPSPRPATEIEYLERRSPLCGVVLRDHSRERLIRCHVKLRFGCIVHLNGKPFSFNRTSFSFKRTSFSLKRTPFSFQTFTHTFYLSRACPLRTPACAPTRHAAIAGSAPHHQRAADVAGGRISHLDKFSERSNRISTIGIHRWLNRHREGFEQFALITGDES